MFVVLVFVSSYVFYCLNVCFFVCVSLGVFYCLCFFLCFYVCYALLSHLEIEKFTTDPRKVDHRPGVAIHCNAANAAVPSKIFFFKVEYRHKLGLVGSFDFQFKETRACAVDLGAQPMHRLSSHLISRPSQRLTVTTASRGTAVGMRIKALAARRRWPSICEIRQRNNQKMYGTVHYKNQAEKQPLNHLPLLCYRSNISSFPTRH